MPRTEEQFKEIREKSKNQILESSIKLFAQKGYYGTSISDIAKDAGISKGLIYNYFESKVSIVEAIYKNMIAMLDNIMGQIYELEEPSEQLNKIIVETIKLTNQQKEFWKLYMSFILQPAPVSFEDIFDSKFFFNYFKEFERIFKAAKVKKPKEEAYEFAAILDGMQMHLIFMEDLYPLKLMKQHILKKYSKEELAKR